jgi:type IV pilus assembly protein PilM
MGLLSKDNGFVGVDIGAYGIKLVQLKKFKGRPQLWTYGVVDGAIEIHLPDIHDKTPQELIDADTIVGDDEAKKQKKQEVYEHYGESDPRVDQYADMLKSLLKKARVTTNLATASLPVSHIFHTIVTLPKVEKESDIDIYITAQLKKVLSRPVEEMQVVHQKIPGNKDDKYLRVLVTAAPKTLVAFYSAIFQKAGLQLKELETEAFAIERSLVGKDTATMMVVDIGSERTNFFIMDGGLPMIHRSIQIGGRHINTLLMQQMGVADTLVENIKADLGNLNWKTRDLSQFRGVLDPVIKEIQYSFDLFLRQTGNEKKKPEKIVLTGGSAVFPPLQIVLEKEFDMRVFVGDPWARVVYQQDLKPLLAQLGPRMSVSIGLALRNIVE